MLIQTDADFMQQQFGAEEQGGNFYYTEIAEGTGPQCPSLKIYSCEFCSYKSAKKIDVTRHRRVHTGERPFKCELCSYSSTQQANLLRHTSVHCCGNCNFRSGDKFQLLLHRKNFHNSK